MSYDLYLFAPEPGVAPMDQLAREQAPGPAETVRMHRLAEVILALDPAYEKGLARPDLIQITAEDGLDISLQPASAAVSFPYRDSLDAERLARDVDAVAAAVRSETGWPLYDPQLERFVDSLAGTPEFAARFDAGRAVVREAAATPAPAEPAPAAPAPAASEPPAPKPGLLKRLFGGG